MTRWLGEIGGSSNQWIQYSVDSLIGGPPRREVGHVFGRGQKFTRQDLARAEFGQSMDHFRKAATHAAGGIGATVGPMADTAKGRVGSARGYLGPGATRMSQAASQGWD